MHLRLVSVAVTVAAVSLAAPILPARAAPVVTTDQAVAALSPAAQASLLQPLRELAGVLDAQGRSRWPRSYAGVSIDAAEDALELFSTDSASGDALLGAARRAAPTAEWGRVRLRTASYSRAALDAAAVRVLAGPQHAALRAVSVAPDGSGLDVEPEAGTAVTRVVPATLGVAVRVRATATRTAKSWSDIKWHDSSPFIGGDVLTDDGHGICTAGLPAVRRKDRVPVLMTAAHCFSTGRRVYTGGGTPGSTRNGRIGRYVGTVGTRNTRVDAEPLTGTDNNADESDTTGWKPLTSVGYSYVGDYVCQSGAASFYLGHPTPCGIKVTDDDIYYSIGGHVARGVEGIDVRHGWGSHNGDSGGTVFAVEPQNRRQARGMISSGGRDGTYDQRRVDWTEAVDIFRAYGLELNPRT